MRGNAFSNSLTAQLKPRIRNAMRSFSEQVPFKSLLLADADVLRVLTPDEIEKAFDLTEQLRNVDAIFERVFKPAPVEAEPVS